LPELDIGGERKIIGIPLIVLGAVIELVAYQHWFANERAMRLNEPLPQSRLVLVLAIGVAVVGAIATVVATTQ
jgi:putative membrane protein